MPGGQQRGALKAARPAPLHPRPRRPLCSPSQLRGLPGCLLLLLGRKVGCAGCTRCSRGSGSLRREGWPVGSAGWTWRQAGAEPATHPVVSPGGRASTVPPWPPRLQDQGLRGRESGEGTRTGGGRGHALRAREGRKEGALRGPRSSPVPGPRSQVPRPPLQPTAPRPPGPPALICHLARACGEVSAVGAGRSSSFSVRLRPCPHGQSATAQGVQGLRCDEMREQPRGRPDSCSPKPTSSAPLSVSLL